MTVGKQVKQSLSSLKHIQASFQSLALKSRDETTKQIFHESMLEIDTMISELTHRVSTLEFEEPQYRG